MTPFCVQVESTEGCNLRCTFCGLNGIRGAIASNGLQLKFMTLETAETIASQIASASWNPRIEFAMHGEPTLNPLFPNIVDTFRRYLPKAYMLMESNGGGLQGDSAGKILNLFHAGLNTVALDEYQGIDLVPKIINAMDKDFVMKLDGADVDVFFYPGQPKGNPHQRQVRRRLVFIAPIDAATKGTHSTLNNHSGCGAPKNDKAYGKRCAKPFREISVRWDGNVAVCCNDWRGTYKCGSIYDRRIDEIWKGPEFEAARRKLYRGERDFGPCDGCDAISYRTGLLPDPKGLEAMAEPTLDDYEVIETACGGQPYTNLVLREWEIVNIDSC